MPLTIGTRLGPYEVTGLIGAGGMGEVYRARDTKLQRDVALKVLPDEFAHDPERLARFQREAQILASLNHPNIAAIHGLEEADGVKALVLELVDGPTLAERIAEGPLPLDEVLPIAKQIAEALEAAHEHGVIHRDLKPANIKIRPDGTVKVLDFGLAKLTDPLTRPSGSLSPGGEEGWGEGASQAPTLTTPAATRMGVILGTAAYMSPEQARGRQVDKRSDVWAFGCVLYEMLTGKRAFDNEDVSDTLARVLMKEPKWAALPKTTPPALRRLLRRCLEKDSRRRLRDIGDARVELESPEPSDGVTVAGSTAMPARYVVSWVVAAVLLALVALALAVIVRETPLQPQLARLQLLPPEGSTFGAIAVSPDGRRLAFTAVGADGNRQLWVRALDSVTAEPLPNTEGASYPFWSPDSRFIGFFADGRLKRIDPAGGAPQTICALINERGGPRGGTWSRDGTILFAVEPFGPEPLYQVAAAGGEPRPLAHAQQPARRGRFQRRAELTRGGGLTEKSCTTLRQTAP